MKLPLRVMQPLSLEHEGAWYPTLVLDFDDQRSLVVGVPQERSEEVIVEPGALVTVDVLLPDGIRRFRTPVLKRVADSPPSLVLAWPGELERIQRRDYFRVSVEVRAEAVFHDPGMRARRTLTGSTLDVSGGGTRLALPEPINDGTLLDLMLTIPGAGTQSCGARVVRWGERADAPASGRYWVACEFADPTEAFRKEVTRFVFDIQRDQLRKGTG